MSTTVFILSLAFTNFDDCVSYMDAHNISGAQVVCESVETEPYWTVRPKARPWGDKK